MPRKLKSAAALIVAVSVIAISAPWIYGILEATRTVGGSGIVKAVGVGVYWDAGCTNNATSIDWGMVEPGSAKNVTIYVKNEGNIDVTLSLNATNWSPENALGYMTLSWNYGGQSISPGEVIQVTLTLAVSSDTQGITSFSFDIIITGTG